MSEGRVRRRLRVTIAGRVLAGFLGFVLGICFVLFLTDLTAVDRAYVESATKATDDYRHAAEDEISQRCIWLLPLQAEECRYNANNTAAEQAHEERDLAAQQQTAWWTKWMGLAGIVGVLASLVGVGLVWFTFRETRAATRVARREYGRARIEARKAANEAEKSLSASRRMAAATAKQVAIAQDTAYRQLRAYLSIEQVTIERITAESISGKLTIRNAGRNPRSR